MGKDFNNEYRKLEDKLSKSLNVIPEFREILENINNLSNHILSNASSKKLIR